MRASCKATAARNFFCASAGIAVCNGLESVDTVGSVPSSPPYPKPFPHRYPNLAVKLNLYLEWTLPGGLPCERISRFYLPQSRCGNK
jgi:hypothetical protein